MPHETTELSRRSLLLSGSSTALLLAGRSV
jgi:hypothetical protein